MMLIAVLRDELHVRKAVKDSVKLASRLVADDMEEGSDAYFKFRTGDVNWPIFRDYVLRPLDDELRKSIDAPDPLDAQALARNKALVDNLGRLRQLVASWLSDAAEPAATTKLQTFAKDVIERVELVSIQVKSLADAFLLFETLNDRGLQLSAADLLKSHLLGEIAKSAGTEDVDTAASQWDGMLSELGADVDVSRFLRHYLLGRYPKVQKDDVFGFFREIVKQSGAQAVLTELREAARVTATSSRRRGSRASRPVRCWRTFRRCGPSPATSR